MPIYTYRCENCGVQFEKNQKFSDALLTRCPECGKKTLRKVYTPVGIVFKGSGFYSTDHRSPSGGTRGGSHGEHGEHSEHGESSSSQSESKPEGESKSSSESKPSKDGDSASAAKTSSTDGPSAK